MKTAFVTGSSRGIGRGIADLLTKEGWTVVYSGTKKERPLDLPDSIDYFPCDISKTEDRQAAVQYVASHYGRFDLLVNNAGVAPLERRDLLDMTEESFDRVVGINLKGTLFMTQLAAREMLREKEAGIKDWGPHIVNIGSMSAYTSSISRGEYCVSKAGVGMVTMLFADRLAKEGIPVFEVRPGIIDTDMTKVVHEKYQRLIDGGAFARSALRKTSGRCQNGAGLRPRAAGLFGGPGAQRGRRFFPAATLMKRRCPSCVKSPFAQSLSVQAARD